MKYPILIAALLLPNLAHAQSTLLSCGGSQNKFGRPAPMIEIKENRESYLLTMTDASNKAATSFILERNQIEVAQSGGGYSVEVKSVGPMAKKFFSLTTRELTAPEAMGNSLRLSANNQIHIAEDFSPPALRWMGTYLGGACQFDSVAIAKKLADSANR